MKYLGIDYGKKRIGIATSDDGGMLAFPYVTIQNTAGVFSEIQKIIHEEKVDRIIIGMPMSFSGEMSPQGQEIKRFGDALSGSLECPITYENEILTTKMAERGGGSSKMTIDQSAAALILQSFLDRQQKKNSVN